MHENDIIHIGTLENYSLFKWYIHVFIFYYKGLAGNSKRALICTMYLSANIQKNIMTKTKL